MKLKLDEHNELKSESEASPGDILSGEVGTFSSLRVPNYRWYWLSTLFSFTAMQMQMVARGWLVYEMTDSPLALGLMAAAWGLPALLLAPLGGVLADRLERRNLIVFTQIATSLIALALTVLIITDLIDYRQLLIASLITGISDAMNMPARQAIIPQLVGRKQLLNAIALGASGMNLTRTVAPAIAGVLVGLIGISGVFIITTGFYVFAVGAALMLPTLGVLERLKKTSVAKDLIVGLRYTRYNLPVLVLLVMSFVSIVLGWPYMILMPVFARDVLSSGPQGLGMLMSAAGGGSLLGSLGVASQSHFKHKGVLLIIFGVVYGVGLVLFAGSTSFYLSIFILFVVGVISSAYYALQNTLIQSNISDEMRGRVMSIFQMTFGMQTIGTLFLSGIGESVGVALAVGGGGLVLTLTMIVLAILVPSLRRL